MGAEPASQALLDQVFIDSGLGLFDSEPGLTAGCESAVSLCGALTPTAVMQYDVSVHASVNDDGNTVFGDLVAFGTVTATLDTALHPSVYAVWSPAPEPGTGALLGLGLARLGVRRRRLT